MISSPILAKGEVVDRMRSNDLETPKARGFPLDLRITLTAIVHPEESGGFSAEVPALPGCFTEGETLDELRDNLRDAAEGWLKAHHEIASATLDREGPGGGDAP